MSQPVGSIDPSTVPGGSGGYELHQKIRTKTVRLLKKEKYDDAINVLYDGSIKLLDMNEQGSKTNAEFWRKKVIQAAVKWSASSSNSLIGDAKLRLFIAELLAKDDQFFAAENHFVAACAQESAGISSFAAMLNRWNDVYSTAMAKEDPKSPPADSVKRVLSGTFALRGWIPLLIARAPDAALGFLHEYIKGATKNNEALLLPVKPNPKEYKSPAMGISSFNTNIYATANPTLNFSQNAVALACDAHHRAGPPSDEIKGAWNLLVRQYMQENGNAVESFLYEFLSQISSTYFGLAPPRRNMDMLSSMLSGMMGGGAPSADKGEPAIMIKQLPKPADVQAKKPAATPSAPNASEADELMDDEMD
ncbi:hypothetical protein MOBT1_001748 [Malassezia obtusa]|uniref:Golgi to ER traffic protein 4 n=1 Tax=Malassezia obtusa TaxID=76774 RepID=A0AAF0E1X0_9BASI|nr:hypothetical protein MOBT1_001748 [Malassezia obtusa]